MNLQTKDYKTFQVGTISFDDYHQANRCLPGDTVSWDGSKCNLVKRANHRTLVGVLELNSKYLYGHTSRGVKIYLFHPLEKSYPPIRVGCSERDTSQNQFALVNFSEWTESIPRGNLIRLLGPVGHYESESVALQWLYGKPELKKITFDIELPSREIPNLEGKTINIDPEGCLDIDDCITLYPMGSNWQFAITIADVAESIPVNSPGDVLAQERCQTLYQKGKAVLPMLPCEISEGSLSLLPGETRRGITLRCVWTGNSLKVQGFEEVQVTNSESFTYETILQSKYPIHILEAIASHLKGQPTKDPHEWIEEFMLLYNREGAKILLKQKAGLLRTHKPVDIDRLTKMDSIHPDLRVYSFESAKYELTEEGKVHATLGSQPYTHLTSPLRRYADLVNQRVLKASLQNTASSQSDPALPAKLNAQQKKQKQHDRDLFFLDHILTNPTGTVSGLVVESTDTKTKVYCPEWKRIIKIPVSLFPPGSPVEIEYYVDLKQVSWKERMVFRIKQEHNTAKVEA